MPLVYLATNKINGKKYVGFTRRTMEYRRYMHFHSARNSARPTVFGRAIRKHGEDAFEFIILDTFDTLQEALDAERKYIEMLRPEYNVSTGGIAPSGVKWTEERREKFSISAKAAWTPERKSLISKLFSGKKLPPERIEAMRLMDRSFQFKSVVCLNDALFFKSVKDAAQHYGINKNNIGGMLSGGHTRCNGLSFAFSDREMTTEERQVHLDALEARRVAWNARRNADKRRPVVCLTDGIEHESCAAAAKKYGIAPSRIMQLCQNGGSTNSGISFRYADSPAVVKRERTDCEREAQHRAGAAALARGLVKIRKRVILVEGGEIFDSIADAIRKYRLNEKQLYHCIKFGYDYWGYTFRLLDADGKPIIVQSGRKKLRKVICIDDGVINEGRDTVARRYGVSRSTLTKLCDRGDDKAMLGGHRFSYLDQWCENAA